MNWQDTVLTLGTAVLTSAALTSAWSRSAKVPRATSLPTAVVVGMFAMVHWNLGLFWTTMADIVCAGAWAFIAFRRS